MDLHTRPFISPFRLTNKGHWYAGTASTILTFLVLLFTTPEIGVTWDEPIYNTTAEAAARWLGLIVRGQLADAFDPFVFGVSWGLMNEHPPLMRVVNGLGWVLTRHILPVPVSHRFGALMLAALTTEILVAAVARRRGVMIGLFTGAALLTMPRVFFHAHLAALDFPLAAFWLLATLGFYTAVQKLRWWSPLLIGAGLGLALLTKINAVLLIPYWVLWLLIFRRKARAWLAFFLGLPVGLAVLIAGWPWIWKDPIGGLVNWIKFFQVHFEIRQWFAGQLYVNTPWYLPPVIVAITTPALLLLLAAVGALNIGKRSSRSQNNGALLATDWTGLHLLGLAVVLGYYMLPITKLHDQDRLLMPAFIHLAVLAGDGFDALLNRLKQQQYKRGRFFLGPALAAFLLFPGVLGIVRLHPFELSYYNELVGGVRGAARLGMETTYFASTYGHFLPYLNQLPPGSRLWVMPNSWDVIYYYQLHGLLRDDLVVLRPPGWGSFYDSQGVLWEEGGLEKADYALIDRRQTTFNNVISEYAIQLEWASSKPVIAHLEREGVVLATLHSR